MGQLDWLGERCPSIVHRLRSAPLRVFLIAPVVLQVGIAVAIIAGFSVQNGRRSIHQIASQLRHETTQRIETEVESLLSDAQVVNQLTVDTIQREAIDLQNIRSLDDLYWDYLQTFPEIRGLGVGNSFGDILGFFKRVENGETAYFLEYSNEDTHERYVSLQLDGQRQIVQRSEFDRQIDARERPWYQAAQEAGEQVWTEIYPSVSEVEGHSLAMNISQPIYDSSDRLQGVVSVILDLGQLSRFLSAIELSPSGQIYILESDGYLVGSSDGNNPIGLHGDDVQRLSATQSETRLIRESALYLRQNFDRLEDITTQTQLEFWLDGERQLLQLDRIQINDQLQWYVAIVVPESDLMAGIQAQQQLTLWICLIAILASTASSILISRWVSQPLFRLNRAVKAVAQGNLDQTVQVEQVAELNELANSFNQMALQLQTLFSRLSSLNQDLADRENQLQQYLEALPIGVLIHDKSSRLIYVNQVGKRLLSMQQVVQVTADRLAETYQIYHADTHELYPTEQLPIALALQGEATQVDNIEVCRDRRTLSLEVKATPIFNENGSISYAIAVLQDITARKSAEQQLLHNARHDLLTGLPNRNLLMEQLEFNLAYAQQVSSYQFALLFIDLDRFKVINDSLGHLAGDELLIQIAHLLTNFISPPDLVARLGGDEYILLLNDIDGIQDAISVAQQVLTTLSEPFLLLNRSVFISASIGIVLASSNYSQASDILRDADIAMYRAKLSGKARYEIFNIEMYTTVLNRLQLEHELRDAIAQQSFNLNYQPIVALKTGELIGFEALVRWQRPSRGIIPPDKFIPLVEEMGLINDLTIWVLQEACRQLADWRDRIPTLPLLKMSVNLSVKNLDENLIRIIEQILAETDIAATCLTLEVTEGMLIHDIQEAIAFLTAIKQLGVTISIDDFGTGYSSLNYLCRLPVDHLKIDRSFVSSMQEDARNQRIVETIIALSNELGLDAIAEGVETMAQQDHLGELGCEFAQGYFFSRPQDATTLSASLTQGQFRYPL